MKIYEQNPHYIQDNNGNPIFLIGGGSYTWVNDYISLFNNLYNNRCNYVRVLCQDREPNSTDCINQITPHLRVSGYGTSSISGCNKFDLTQFNPEFWSMLKNHIEYANSKGIYLHLSLFNHINYKNGTIKPWRWAGCAWNIDNNINKNLIGDLDRNNNGEATGNNEFYDYNALIAKSWNDLVPTSVNDTQAQQRFNLATLQKAYVNKYITETSNYSNIFYEIGNEIIGNSDWVKYWISYINNKTDKIITSDSHVTINSGYQPLTNSNVDGETFHSATIVNNKLSFRSDLAPQSNVYNYNKLLIADTDGSNVTTYNSPEINRKGVWSTLTSGFSGWQNYDESAANPNTFNHDLYNQFKSFQKILIDNNIPFWRMSPHNELTTNGNTLANPNKDYLIYLVNGGTTTIDLSLMNYPIYVDWYNPREGNIYNSTTIPGNKTSTFNSPDSNDWVLFITNCRLPKCDFNIQVSQ